VLSGSALHTFVLIASSATPWSSASMPSHDFADVSMVKTEPILAP
jgi:hypothetical protein